MSRPRSSTRRPPKRCWLALRQLNDDLGLTVILSEHRLERVVQYADRMLYLPALGRAARDG